MQRQTITLAPFLETIENKCQSLQKEELIDLLIFMAKQIEPSGRDSFLQNFTMALPTNTTETVTRTTPDVPQILTEIEELGETIEERVLSIEDGSYWDDPDEEDWDDEDYRNYHDYDADLLNHDQIDELYDFFSLADLQFINGQKTEAKNIYHALFSILDETEKYGFLPDMEINLRETRARFAKCVYEISDSTKRVDTMMEALRIQSQRVSYGYHAPHYLPLLQDVLDADSSELQEFDVFLTAWIKELEKESPGQVRIADLLLEATFMRGEVTDIGKLARKWQAKQPRGYLYWLGLVEAKEDWPGLKDIAEEAIAALRPGSDRYKAASFLIIAGENLCDDTVVLTGYREKFFSEPKNTSMATFITEAARQGVREEKLDTICSFYAKQKPNSTKEMFLFIAALIMAGKIDQAYNLCHENRVFDYSATAAGLLFSSALYLLCCGNASCSNLIKLLKDYCDHDVHSFNMDEFDDRQAGPSFYQEIVNGLQLIDQNQLDREKFRKWTGAVGEQYVNNIVSETHRGSYDNAASILTCLAEVIASTGNTDKARSLLHEYCRVLYNRHTAFRREVRAAAGGSVILKGLNDGL